MEPLHDDEADTGSEVVLDLLQSQAPHLAALSLARISGTAGNTGSDNVLYRLGTELVVRLPRTPSAATSLRTETRLHRAELSTGVQLRQLHRLHRCA